MANIHLTLDNVAATRSFAQKMASLLPAGTMIAMEGEMGSGKTTFAQGFAQGLGIRENVGSPTFKLVSEYTGTELKLYHIDCYRLENENDFFNIGGEQYLVPNDGITLIEWAEMLKQVLPENCIRIHFSRIADAPDKRDLVITGLEL